MLSAASLALAGPAAATPIAHNDAERAQYGGRVIPEPVSSTDYVQFGTRGAEPELQQAFSYLQRLYPNYVRLTTMAKALHDPNAVSTGKDGIPAGVRGDTGDGLPLYEIVLTDRSVPDAGKAYVSLMFGHSAEACGREATLREVEDLALAAASDSPASLDDGTGSLGGTHRTTARELLRHVKVFVSVTSPDGWAAGDAHGHFSQENGAGLNSNRVAYQEGFSYYGDALYANGYSTATQAEGLAFTRYLSNVRRRELGGRPFTAGADMHGPALSGTALTQDQGNDPVKIERNQDYAQRARAKSIEVLKSYIGPLGDAYGQAGIVKDFLREYAINYYSIPDAWLIPAEWLTLGTVWDQLGYTHGAGWASWMNSDAGLDAPSITYELNCTLGGPADPVGLPWQAPLMQLFVDNVRGVLQSTLVRAAAPPDDGVARVDLGGAVGYYDTGARVTDRDGNPSPPPAHFPNKPLLRQVAQKPYDVSPTDWFRDAAGSLVSSPIRRVTPSTLARQLPRLSTLAVTDVIPARIPELRRWVQQGGNLVLTDGALRALPGLGIGTPADIRRDLGYVGYSDFKLDDPLTQGLPNTARQTYDPIGLGYQVLVERDPYYKSGDTGTKNDAPIWSIAAGAVTAPPGGSARVVGTASPPADGKATREGSGTDRATIGVIRLGKGRITFFGALLPTPTEANPHWFGLDGYTISYAGQTMLLRSLAKP